MNRSISPDAAGRTRQILEDLEAVRENLLGLSDNIWLSNYDNDPQPDRSGGAVRVSLGFADSPTQLQINANVKSVRHGLPHWSTT